MKLYLLVIAAVTLSGCNSNDSKPQTRTEEVSPIVRAAENAGAGDLTSGVITTSRMGAYFSAHKDLARSLDPQCRARAKQTDADERAHPGTPLWSHTVEGVVCSGVFMVTYKPSYGPF